MEMLRIIGGLVAFFVFVAVFTLLFEPAEGVKMINGFTDAISQIVHHGQEAFTPK